MQLWRVPHLWVAGASAFPQNSSGNSALTVLAIAYRAADTVLGHGFFFSFNLVSLPLERHRDLHVHLNAESTERSVLHTVPTGIFHRVFERQRSCRASHISWL
jgi:hypothetical protein